MTAATIERVSVPTETSAAGGRTNAYLVAGDGGALLVDPAARTADLDAAVGRVDVRHVAITHAHPDHVGAVAGYAGTLDATVWARDGHVDRFEAATGVAPDRTVGDGGSVGPATALATPGHAPDHLAFAVGDAVLVGDLAVAEGSVLVGGPGADVAAYLDSLRRLAAREPSVLYPGHGPAISDPVATLSRLIDHRLDREARVLAAVRAGARTPDDVVDAAYGRDLGDARRLARLAVGAHLDKLAAEGRVVWDGERARPV